MCWNRVPKGRTCEREAGFKQVYSGFGQYHRSRWGTTVVANKKSLWDTGVPDFEKLWRLAQLYSFCLFCILFAVVFYLYRVLGYVCNFPCLHLTFLVLLYAFWWWMLCFNCFVLCFLHLLLPLPPCFLFFFLRRHFILFSPLYATMIDIVMIVFIIVVFLPSSYYF